MKNKVLEKISGYYLQEHGATITGLADFTVPVNVVTDPREVKETDALIVTVKTYDMEVALDSVKHIQAGSVLSIQNGVVKNEQLADVFGWEKVLGAMAGFSAELLPTGIVRFTSNQGFHLGELPEGASERVQTLADILNQAVIPKPSTSTTVVSVVTTPCRRIVLAPSLRLDDRYNHCSPLTTAHAQRSDPKSAINSLVGDIGIGHMKVHIFGKPDPHTLLI